MDNKVEQIAAYTEGLQFNDLPDDVIHEMKRVILDSVGCAFSGQKMRRGKAAASVAKKIGGPAEATIFGINGKVNCMDAAFANGESMNAMDYDALSTAVVHDVPIIIPATLALSESTRASGKKMILATAIAFEVSARLKAAGARPSKNKSGKMRWPPVLGYSAATVAASVGASKIMGLDSKKMSNAISIAASITPPNIFRNFLERTPIQTIKYGAMGWQSKAGITAALLADEEYTGYAEVFEGKYGFYRYTGMGAVPKKNMEDIFSDLGIRWTCNKIRYKRYPACGHLLPALNKFIEIINENNIKPDNITGIELHLDALSKFPLFKKNNIKSPDDYCFHAPYLLTCAANRIPPEHWHDDKIKKDSVLNKFMQRVKFVVTPDERESGMTNIENAIKESQMSIKVKSNGESYMQKLDAIATLDDNELARKFTENVSGFLPSDKIKITVKQILNLEKITDINQLMDLLKL